MAKQRGLGKGLSSLIPTTEQTAESVEKELSITVEETTPTQAQEFIDCDNLFPNPFQPRHTINDEQLGNLAASIREHGVIQPILVRKAEIGYQIVAGERRWRAAQLAGVTAVPTRILEITDAQAMELALVENLQREDLSAIEVAQGIYELISKLSLTHEEVAQKIGLSRTAVTNKLRLLQLPDQVVEMLENEDITEGHARALLSLPSAEKIIEYAQIAIEKNLNVRQLEQLVRNSAAAAKIDASLPRKAGIVTEFEDEIERLNRDYRLTVRVAGNRKNMGLLIKGLKKWQVQLLLEYIERHHEELFPRE